MKKFIALVFVSVLAVILFAQPSPVSPPVSQIVAGTGISISPTNGRGTVTVNATGAASGAITGSGLTMNTGKLLGRTTASSGSIEEITPGNSISLSAGTVDTVQDLRTSASPAFAGVSTGSFQTTSSAFNAQTGTTYSLQASDNGKTVTLNNASAITLTVPSGLGAGFSCVILQLGAGQVTVTASSTTIHNYYGNTKLIGQYAQGTLTAYVADTFVFSGESSP